MILQKLKMNIGVSVHYTNPLPKMSYYNYYNLKIKDYKNVDKYGKLNVSLPVYPKLKNKKLIEFATQLSS